MGEIRVNRILEECLNSVLGRPK